MLTSLLSFDANDIVMDSISMALIMEYIMARLLKIFGLLIVFAGSPVCLWANETIANASADAYRTFSLAIGSALAIGIAVVGGALGQGKAIASAMEGIGRNPGSSEKIFVPMVIGLALIESLVIFALLIAYMLLGKIS